MKHLLTALFIFSQLIVLAQNCVGGAILTKANHHYGRFEVNMKSAEGDGVVSSFFLYNVDLDCNWPQENNEIDIEMTGNLSDGVYFTTHYPDASQPWSFGTNYTLDYNPHQTFHTYAFEWEPNTVRWFVDDSLVYTQSQSFVAQLNYPMRIIMNLWAASAVSWVGVWDPSILPVESNYDWVKYYAYTPGNGNYGTNNNFTFSWVENFDSLNTEIWEVTEFGGFSGNYCTFNSSSVAVNNGLLTLQIEEENPNLASYPVTIRLNAKGQNFSSSDVLSVNGSFNNWCGNCLPMQENNSIYPKTLFLNPGKYEFVFGRNNWAEVGQPNIGSACDYNPCDMYGNYGFLVSENSNPNDTLFTDVYCWNACTNCAPVYTCPDHLNMNAAFSYLGSGTYGAVMTLTSNHSILDNEETYFYANDFVLLNAGFSTVSNCTFEADIDNVCY